MILKAIPAIIVLISILALFLTSGYLTDLDSDSIVDTKDNCPKISNPDQKDDDFDKVGNDCDYNG